MNILKTLLILLTTIASFNGWAQGIPKEVSSFVDTRNTCDHFRSEPLDLGGDPEVKERREFLFKIALAQIDA